MNDIVTTFNQYGLKYTTNAEGYITTEVRFMWRCLLGHVWKYGGPTGEVSGVSMCLRCGKVK